MYTIILERKIELSGEVVPKDKRKKPFYYAKITSEEYFALTGKKVMTECSILDIEIRKNPFKVIAHNFSKRDIVIKKDIKIREDLFLSFF